MFKKIILLSLMSLPILLFGVVLDGAVDAVQVVRHRGEVAGGELRPQGSGTLEALSRGATMDQLP